MYYLQWAWRICGIPVRSVILQTILLTDLNRSELFGPFLSWCTYFRLVTEILGCVRACVCVFAGLYVCVWEKATGRSLRIWNRSKQMSKLFNKIIMIFFYWIRSYIIMFKGMCIYTVMHMHSLLMAQSNEDYISKLYSTLVSPWYVSIYVSFASEFN